MGSRNAKQVTLHGGWLKPNAYKLLQVMAWNSYDDPVPKKKVEEARAKGDPEPRPCVYYANAKTSYEQAFGKAFPEKPRGRREDWTAADKEQEKRHLAAMQAVKEAIMPLTDLAIAERIRSAKVGSQSAAYRLQLIRLLEGMPVGNSYQDKEENPTDQGRKNLPESSNDVGNSYPAGEEKPTPDKQRDFQPLNKQASNIHRRRLDNAGAPEATTGALGEGNQSNPLEDTPDDIETNRRQQLLALEKLINTGREAS